MKTNNIQERPNRMLNYTNRENKISIYTHTNIGMYEIIMDRSTLEIYVQTEPEERRSFDSLFDKRSSNSTKWPNETTS